MLSSTTQLNIALGWQKIEEDVRPVRGKNQQRLCRYVNFTGFLKSLFENFSLEVVRVAKVVEANNPAHHRQ